MPIRKIDVDKLESCEDYREEPRKKKSVVLSLVGISFILVGVGGLTFFGLYYGQMGNRPNLIKVISKILEILCIASLVLLFVAFKFHKKNKPFLIFLFLWIGYLIWFMVAMTVNIPFF